MAVPVSHLRTLPKKVESKNEEIWDKVRARAVVATDSGEGATELRQQIAKLMAVLTKSGQGSNHASAPSSPRDRDCGRGCADRGTAGCPSSHNCQTSLGQTVPDCSTPSGHGTGVTISRNQGQMSHRTNARHGSTTNRRDPNSLQQFRCQGWTILQGNVSLQPQLKTSLRGTKGMWPYSLPVATTTSNSRPPSFPPRPKTNTHQSSLKDGTAGSCLSPFLNLDCIVHLVGTLMRPQLLWMGTKWLCWLTWVTKSWASVWSFVKILPCISSLQVGCWN